MTASFHIPPNLKFRNHLAILTFKTCHALWVLETHFNIYHKQIDNQGQWYTYKYF